MSDESEQRLTPSHQVRVPRSMWEAWGRITTRRGVTRTARILDTLRADIVEHGDETDRADLEAGEKELAQRRARLSPGRPRRSGH